MKLKYCEFNKHTEKKIDLKSKDDIDYLKWIGLYCDENLKLIKDNKLRFFEENYSFEGVAVIDYANDEVIVIDYRGI